MTQFKQSFSTVYGPVQSWRFGRSLGIDPIGLRSTCSFNCVYCQLGIIQDQTMTRSRFVETQQIVEELKQIDPVKTPYDVVTLSGSGEPTLALNLAEIITQAKTITGRPVVVLTNGSLLGDREVQAALNLADQVAVKLDAVSVKQLQRVNRPTREMQCSDLFAHLQFFADHYWGELALQTMVLSPWSAPEKAQYIEMLQQYQPDEVQLNAPARPQPKTRQLEARGNAPFETSSSALQTLQCVTTTTLQDFAEEIERLTGIPTRYPQLQH